MRSHILLAARAAVTHLLQPEALIVGGVVLAVSALLGNALGGPASISTVFGVLAALAFGMAVTRAAFSHEREEGDAQMEPVNGRSR